MILDDQPCRVIGLSSWYMYRCACVGEIFAYEDRPLTERELQAIKALPGYND